MPATPPGAKAHLDLAAAKMIRKHFLASQDLDLMAYSTASMEALECLKPLDGGFATLGFTAVTPDMAMVLGDWKTYFLCFTHLQSLWLEAASHLGNAESGHGLVFEWPMALSVATARAVAGNGAPLHLTLQAAPDLPCAEALATHTHELYLTWSDGNIEPSVASALGLHAGYFLHLTMSSKPWQAPL